MGYGLMLVCHHRLHLHICSICCLCIGLHGLDVTVVLVCIIHTFNLFKVLKYVDIILCPLEDLIWCPGPVSGLIIVVYLVYCILVEFQVDGIYLFKEVSYLLFYKLLLQINDIKAEANYLPVVDEVWYYRGPKLLYLGFLDLVSREVNNHPIWWEDFLDDYL